MICEFKGKNGFLSSFSISNISYTEKIYPTAEHLYQALKTCDFCLRERIRCSSSPGLAKAQGKLVILRFNWDKIRDRCMHQVVKMKFNQNLDLRQKLMVTFPLQLVEGNYWHDNYWGNCLCDRCGQIDGQNKLGKILMEIRDNYEKGMI